jgi:hypothetical protein
LGHVFSSGRFEKNNVPLGVTCKQSGEGGIEGYREQVRRDVQEVNLVFQELLFIRHELIRVVLAQFSAYMHWFIEGGVHVHVTILVDADVLR